MLNRVLIFFVIACYNALLLFDSNVPPDFFQYQRYWENATFPLFPIEFIFNLGGYLLNSFVLDFRFYIFVLNLILIFRLTRYLTVTAALVMLFSPFTILGFGNTVLSFTAGMMWLNFFLTENKKINRTNRLKLQELALPMFIHKGAIFLVFIRQNFFLIVMICFTLFYLSSFIPFMGALKSKAFETGPIEVVAKFVMVYLAVILVFFLKKENIKKYNVFLSPGLLLITLFYIATKLADRVVVLLFFHGFGLYLTHEKALSGGNRIFVAAFCVTLSCLFIALSGVKNHLPGV